MLLIVILESFNNFPHWIKDEERTTKFYHLHVNHQREQGKKCTALQAVCDI